MRAFINITLLAAAAFAFYAGSYPYEAGKLLDAIGAAIVSMIRVG